MGLAEDAIGQSLWQSRSREAQLSTGLSTSGWIVLDQSCGPDHPSPCRGVGNQAQGVDALAVARDDVRVADQRRSDCSPSRRRKGSPDMARTVRFPPICARCARLPPTTTITVSQHFESRTISVEVPICQRCKAVVERRRKVVAIIMITLLGIGVGVLLLAWVLSLGWRASELGTLTALMVLAWIIGLFLAPQVAGIQFAKFGFLNNHLYFENGEYQRLFDELNKPSSLSSPTVAKVAQLIQCYPIAGQICVFCQRRVEGLQDGAFCDACYSPAHWECRQPGDPIDAVVNCKECGAVPGLRYEQPRRGKRG